MHTYTEKITCLSEIQIELGNLCFICSLYHYGNFLLHDPIIFFVGLFCVTYGILVPWPGIEPRPLAVKAWHLSHWIARKFPNPVISDLIFFSSTNN